MMTREEIVGMVPQLRADDVLGGSFCPTDGFVDPYSVMVGFTTRACEQGATLWRSTEVTAINRESGRITGVETTARSSKHADGGERRWPVGSRSGISGGNQASRGAYAAHADPDGAVRRSVARSADGGRHDHRLSFSAGESGISAGVERSPGDDGLQHRTSSRRSSRRC